MLMWADRLIDGKSIDMGEWEASKVGTAPAVDKIPKDIILCPWHYEMRGQVRVGANVHGERLSRATASWKNTDATLALIRYAQARQSDGRLVGHIFTTWGNRSRSWAEFEPLQKGLPLLQEFSPTKAE